MFNFDEKRFMFMGHDCDKGVFPPEKPRFTKTEDVLHTEALMKDTIDRLLRFEERAKRDIGDLLSQVANDNNIFKGTMRDAWLTLVQEVKNEINSFESNMDAAVSLFQGNMESNYDDLASETRKQVEECINRYNAALEDFREALYQRVDDFNSNNSLAFADYKLSLDTRLNEFEAGIRSDFNTFKTALNSVVENFKTEWSENMKGRFDTQDAKISDAVAYMKTNLNGSVTNLLNSMKDDGSLVGFIESEVFVTPEFFNAAGDGATNDTAAINAAISYSKTNNVPLFSLGKKYLVTSDITFDGIEVDFRGGTIVGAGTLNIVDAHVYNLHVEDMNVVTTGSDVIIDTLFIDKWTGTGLTLGNGTYSRHIKNIHFKQPDEVTDYANNIGIVFDCSDTFVDGMYGYGFKTAIRVLGSQNGITNAQPWINHHKNFTESTFLVLRATNFSISDSIIDTWNYVFVGSTSFLECSLKNVSYIHNTTMCPDEHVILFTNCKAFKGELLVKMTDFASKGCSCEIGDFSHVNVYTIDGELSKPTRYKVDKLTSLLPTIANGTYSVVNGSYIGVNGGKFESHLWVKVNGTTAGGSVALFNLNGIAGIKDIDIKGKAMAVVVTANGTIPAWVYYEVNANGELYISLPTGVTGWWELTINEVIDCLY